MRLGRLGLCGACWAAGATALWAQAEEAERLAGGWGARENAESKGVLVYANYTAEVFANTHGGYARGETFEGVAEAGVELDMERLAGWTGAALFAGGMNVHGDDPTVALVGDYNYASNIVAENTTRWFQIGAELQRDGWAMKAGLLSVDDAFMISEQAQLFVNSGFGPMPSISGNTVAPIWPVSGLGVTVQVTDIGGWSWRAGVYDGDAGDELSNRRGTTVRLRSDEGAMVLVEAAREFSLAGRKGVFTAGAWKHSGLMQDFQSADVVRGNEGVHVMLEQRLDSRESTGAEWRAFLRAGLPLRERRNTVRLHSDVGVTAKGLLPGRKEDVAGLVVCRTDFGRDYRAARESADGADVSARELVVELTYAIALGRGVTLQPDVQYIVDPHESRNDALAYILRVSADF